MVFRIGEVEITKPLLLWINDSLMAIFFFLIGLAVKREILDGELSDPSRVVLPVIGGVGGMVAPAIIYATVNWGDPVAMRGWAIPSATDIAFALAVMSLLGSRVPSAFKLMLMTLAIVDDLSAIVIIGAFLTTDLSIRSLGFAALATIGLATLNRKGVLHVTPHFPVGFLLWIAVLKSGVHATLAGVIIAMFIPYKKLTGEEHTPLEMLEHDLHPKVVDGILPLLLLQTQGSHLRGFR